jgi:transcriptional regulator with XRE-family HTH domain
MIAQIESGKLNNLTLKTLARTARALGASLKIDLISRSKTGGREEARFPARAAEVLLPSPRKSYKPRRIYFELNGVVFAKAPRQLVAAFFFSRPKTVGHQRLSQLLLGLESEPDYMSTTAKPHSSPHLISVDPPREWN